jgi:hypothetical protein
VPDRPHATATGASPRTAEGERVSGPIYTALYSDWASQYSITQSAFSGGQYRTSGPLVVVVDNYKTIPVSTGKIVVICKSEIMERRHKWIARLHGYPLFLF